MNIQEVAIITRNKEDYMAALQLMKSLSGHNINTDAADGKYWNSHPCVGTTGTQISSYSVPLTRHQVYEYEDVDKMVRDLFVTKKSVTVKLNDEYNAVVSNETVIVGCQTFPISKLLELVEVYKKL